MFILKKEGRLLLFMLSDIFSSQVNYILAIILIDVLSTVVTDFIFIQEAAKFPDF
jgi:hypothetical protein